MPVAVLATVFALVSGCATAPEPSAAPAAEPGQPDTQPDAGSAPEESDRQPGDTAAAAAEEEPEPAPQAPPARPKGLSGQNLYRLLVADLAGRQGDIEVALQGYLETARETRDPRIAERATRLALYAGAEDAAIEAGERWVELQPHSAEAHSVLARLRLRRGEVEQAVAELHQVIDLSEDGTEAGLEQVAKLTGGSSNADAAFAAMARIAEAYPDHAVSHYAVAELAARTDHQQRALDALDRALDIAPDYTDALVLRARVLLDLDREEEAFAGLRAAYRQYPGERDLALGYVRLLVQAGRTDQALEEMQQVHERFGDDPYAVYSLGLLAMQAEAWDDAKLYLERLLQMNARTSVAHYYLGRIAQQEGAYTEALRHYIKVGRGEHRFDAELRAAVCMAEVGRLDEARLHLERMRSRYDDRGADVQIALTRARVERIAGNPDTALQVLGDAVEQQPDNIDLRYSRALAAAELDRFELARSDLEAVLEQDPDNPRALNALGYMLADRNMELARARRMIEHALEQNPDDSATLDSMGWVLYRQGRNDKALEYLQRAYEIEADPEIAAHLGEVLWALGRQAEARDVWERGQASDPDNTVLRETIERLTR